jgi:DNA-binding FadR family transcriptional regulator
VAELVAARLREEILEGRLGEGDVLPRQEDLVADYGVSPPAVREALQILESEGLVSVRRGKVGGAVVHPPSPDRIGYTIGLVLQAQRTELDDVASALQVLEPACAAMCAERPDRHEAVVPVLREILDEEDRHLGDAVAFNREAHRFHGELVARCGNATIILVVGALETLWSAHERRIYERTDAHEPALAEFTAAARDHERLVAAIEAGDAARAARITRKHLEATQAFSLLGHEDRVVRASLLV